MSDFPKIQYSKFIGENQIVIRTDIEEEFESLTGLKVKDLLQNVKNDQKPAQISTKPVTGYVDHTKPKYVAGQPCNKCGAEMILNPKTGKVFCKDKCWLKNTPEF